MHYGLCIHRAPTPPGEIFIEEFLKPMNLTVKGFSIHTGWTYAKLNEIVHGRRGITPEIALDLADALNMEPEFWLNLQIDWIYGMLSRKHKTIVKNSALSLIHELRT
ncbi:putative HTH-type transcriptional regulator YbaQ [Legionella clemsonensis]|uniref:Putative HTH-type transcriptional regulator YbaQ n=2 Tax=Legionella clemsonensis TaxID=1867846 RepID=A0A222NYR9_9GAMM|nr:putative HTH-type transcriptional regulator YbaQ [Legionella clemsonensis]